MGSSKTLMFLGAGLLFLIALPILLIGILFLWASGDGGASASGRVVVGLATSCIGVLMIAGGVVLAWLGLRPKPGDTTQNVTLKVDLPGDVNLETIKCQSCGGVLTMDNIQMVAGAPVVNCPYCKTSYQLTEEPKW
ncbi:MAG: phage holin family protein [Chloroflexota bacterium]